MEPVVFNEEVKTQPTSKVLKMAGSRSGFMCGLTFELSWDRRCDARPARLMINSTASGAWRHAVGPQLERGVRQR
jgi:hypothetical protein